MTCPTCHLASAPDDRICRRCKRDLLTDRRIPTLPQRAERTWRGLLPRRQNLAIAAGLVPGLGHAVLAKPWRGLGYLLTVAWVVQLGLGSPRHGLAFIGIAAAIHAASMMDIARPSLPAYASLPVQICLTLALLTLIYHPAWSTVLGREGSDSGALLLIGQPPGVWTLLVLLTVLLAVAWVWSRRVEMVEAAQRGEE